MFFQLVLWTKIMRCRFCWLQKLCLSMFKFSSFQITRCSLCLLPLEVLFKQLINCCNTGLGHLIDFYSPIHQVLMAHQIDFFYPRFSIFFFCLRLLTPPFSSFLFSRSRDADSICWLKKFCLSRS